MIRALFVVVGGAIVVVPILLLLAASATGSNTRSATSERIAGQSGHSSGDAKYLTAIGLTAIFAVIAIGSNAAAWAALPIGVGLLIFIGMRYRARALPSQETRFKQLPPPARRRETFGRDGVALLERADAAVQKVMTSDAVGEGWLGSPEEIDLRADVSIIEDRLIRVAGIREVIAELSRIPDPSESDKRRKADAKQAETKLNNDARDRVKRLETLAREVQATDHELRLRSLTDVGDGRQAGPPEVVDSTRALLSAYRDVKGLPDLESTPCVDDGRSKESPKPSASSQSFFYMFKQWWSE